MVKLINTVEKSITPSQMKEGQIGVISSSAYAKYLGKIVMRFQDKLIVVGDNVSCYWSNVCELDSMKITLLPEGTMLEIVNN